MATEADTSRVKEGADAEEDDLTVAVTGAYDSSLVLSSAGTGADALKLEASAGSLVASAVEPSSFPPPLRSAFLSPFFADASLRRGGRS